MEDVLRKIYLRKHQEIQRRRRDRQLNYQQTKKRKRIYKSLWQDYRPLVQNFDLETQISLKTQLGHGNDFIQENHRYKIKSVLSPSSQKQLSLPAINPQKRQTQTANNNEDKKKQKQLSEIQQLTARNPQRKKALIKQIQQKYKTKRLIKIFRIRTLTILFVAKLLKLRKQSLLKQRELIQSYSTKLLAIIDKMVNGYYAVLLEEQLLKYLELIKIKMDEPKIMLEKEVLNMLYFMSKKLVKSSVSKDLLQYLVLISGESSFFPTDYLTYYEAYRLKFSLKYGSLQNVTLNQTRMIIALCVGVKIFCAYVLYRPWLLKISKSPILPDQIIRKYDQVKKIIYGTASIFTYLIMEEFGDTVPVVQGVKLSTKNIGLQLKQTIDIFPPHYEAELIQNPGQLFPNQKKKLYLTLLEQNPQIFQDIKVNLKTWLQKIVRVCLKEKEKIDQQRKFKVKEQQKSIVQNIFNRINDNKNNQNNQNPKSQSKSTHSSRAKQKEEKRNDQQKTNQEQKRKADEKKQEIFKLPSQKTPSVKKMRSQSSQDQINQKYSVSSKSDKN